MFTKERVRYAILSMLVALALALIPTSNLALATDELAEPEYSVATDITMSEAEDASTSEEAISSDESASESDDEAAVGDGTSGADQTVSSDDAADGLEADEEAASLEQSVAESAPETPHNTVVSRDGKLYYLTSDGSVLAGAGWHQVDGAWYYADTSSGALHVGWLKNGNHWYWFDPSDGKMATGWRTIGGKHYFFYSTGAMAAGSGWRKFGSSWYYLRSDGSAATGWRKVGGKWYWLDRASGRMATGWTKVDGKWYFLYSSGAMATGPSWRKLGSSWYYLRSDGSAATGWIKSGGKWYYLDPGTRAMAIGWRKVGGSWYYLNGSGAMATGWLKSGGKWYYLRSSGAMATGWLKSGGKWYWLDSSGALNTGWFKLSGKWYWQDGHGCAQDEIRVINGVGWAFDESCVWRTIGSTDQASSARNRRQESLIRSCHSTPSPGAGLCAAWVTDVFVNAGYNHRNLNADEMYDLYCRSSNLADLKPGMIVAVDSHPHTWAGSIWGHVGIYIGNGLIMENVGYIRTSDLGSWIWWYGASHQVRWGWYDNKPLA